MSVYRYKLNNVKFNKLDDNNNELITNYQSLLTTDEKSIIIEHYRTFKKGNLHNGYCVRLEDMYNDILNISLITFYDFVITTAIRLDFNSFYNYLKDIKDEKALKIVHKLYDYFKSLKINSFKDVIKQNNLANVLAISLMVKCSDDRYLIVQRNNKNILGNGIYSVSVTGAVDGLDFESSNPIISCAWRELYEELGLMVDENDFTIKELAMGKMKKQPTAIVNVSTLLDSKSIITQSKYAKDFNKELSNIVALNKEELFLLLVNKDVNLTEVARHHINSIIE